MICNFLDLPIRTHVPGQSVDPSCGWGPRSRALVLCAFVPLVCRLRWEPSRTSTAYPQLCPLFSTGVSDMELEAEAGSVCLSLQEEQTSRIRSLMATEQSPLLEAICHCLEEHGQVGPGWPRSPSPPKDTGREGPKSLAQGRAGKAALGTGRGRHSWNEGRGALPAGASTLARPPAPGSAPWGGVPCAVQEG